ncbi:MAG: HAD family hydrolase [Chloroflexota bacterium]|nr:HAD family hydrolase [Chloroflexota bacterium]
MKLDAIVFDVDGVLVETESSYIEAVARCAQWLLVHELGLADDGPAVDHTTIHQWKRSGRWNDDWDLSYALYEWLAAAPGATTTARRRAAGDAEAAAGRAVAVDRARWEAIRGVFEEIYNGTPVAVARYGVPARVKQQHGLAETETVLLEAGLLAQLTELGIDKVGIVTGRSIVDWEPVRPRIPLPVDVVVATMEDGKKPDPAPLAKVVRMLRPRAFVAVGDTMADLEMVLRWNATPAGSTTPGIAVTLCPREDEATYRAAGATLFIRSLADLPSLLRSASSPPVTRRSPPA